MSPPTNPSRELGEFRSFCRGTLVEPKHVPAILHKFAVRPLSLEMLIQEGQDAAKRQASGDVFVRPLVVLLGQQCVRVEHAT